MKFTNREMGNCIEVMQNLKETGKLAYAIAKNLRKMKEEATEYLDIRNEALKKYGTQNGNLVVVKKENEEAYMNEIGDIADIEADVDIYTVPEDVFIGGTLTSSQMEALLWMVKD